MWIRFLCYLLGHKADINRLGRDALRNPTSYCVRCDEPLTSGGWRLL